MRLPSPSSSRSLVASRKLAKSVSIDAAEDAADVDLVRPGTTLDPVEDSVLVLGRLRTWTARDDRGPVLRCD